MPTVQPHPLSDAPDDLRWWQDRLIIKRLVIGVVSVLLLGVLIGWVGYPAFQDYRKKRVIRIAKVFVETEDYRSAYLLLDQYARNQPAHFEARRLLAKVMEEFGAGQGLAEWEQLVQLEPANAANHIGYITSALRVGQMQKLPEALATLQKLQPDSIDYHRLSAGLALVKGNVVALRRSIETLALLEPNNETTQFNLATLRLTSAVPAEVASARETLEKFVRGDALRIRAMLALIADAPRRWPREKNSAKHYALIVRQLELDKSPLASPAGFMMTGAVRVREPGLPTLVEFLQNQPAPTSEDIAQLAQWMMKLGQTREALVWLETLPGKSRESPAALAHMAACAVALELWDKLESLLRQGAWGPVPGEAVKYAFRARQFREEKNDSRAEAIWNNAVQSSAQSLPGLRMLHRLAQLWRWPGKEAQVLWALVRRFPNDTLAWQKLSEQVLATREAAQVWRFYSAWLQAAPANLQMQVERVVLGLLVRPKEPGLAVQAGELYRAQPNNTGRRLAQALALWRGGLANEALIVLDAVPLHPESEPRVALTRGLVLSAIGRNAESERMFALTKPESLLLEEVALIAAARAGSR